MIYRQWLENVYHDWSDQGHFNSFISCGTCMFMCLQTIQIHTGYIIHVKVSFGSAEGKISAEVPTLIIHASLSY